MVSGVGRGMDVFDRGDDRRKGRDSFGGEFGASHCNQQGIYCIVVQCVDQLSYRLGWRMGSVDGWVYWSTCLKGKGGFGVCRPTDFNGVFVPIY